MCQRFQVVPPCGGHQVSAVHLTASFFVSSRAPVWGASGSEWYNFKFDCVSSRAPVWGASRFLPDCMISTWFQVVPPCGGHPQRLQELEAAGLVSSRAPVWGASRTSSRRYRSPGVSSRAPVWGASGKLQASAVGPAVSSRAPVWGASCQSGLSGIWPRSFKSCPRVGGILARMAPFRASDKFQVVPPCGGHHYQRLPSTLGLEMFQVVPPCGGHRLVLATMHFGRTFQVVPPCGGHRGICAAMADY